jgi:hypothetical protein
MPHNEAHLIQHLHPVHRLGHIGDEEDILAHLPVRGELDPGIAAGGGGDLLQRDLLQQLPP